MNEFKGVPVWLLAILLPILFLQGTWMFIDASKRGKYRWLWGLWGLTNIPTPLLIYIFFVMLPDERKKSHERKG